MRDLMGALRTLALADADILALIGTDFFYDDKNGEEVNANERVYVNRIPRPVIEAASTFHPPKILVLRQAGGFGNADLLPTESQSVNALCYGQTDQEADKVRRAVHQLFKYLSRETHDDVLIHHINPTGGPIPSVEPDLVWPAVAQSYTVYADVMEN